MPEKQEEAEKLAGTLPTATAAQTGCLWVTGPGFPASRRRLGAWAVEAPYGAAVMDRNGHPYGLPILSPGCLKKKKKTHLFARGGSSPRVAIKKERRQPMRAACRLAGAPVSSTGA